MQPWPDYHLVVHIEHCGKTMMAVMRRNSSSLPILYPDVFVIMVMLGISMSLSLCASLSVCACEWDKMDAYCRSRQATRAARTVSTVQ